MVNWRLLARVGGVFAGLLLLVLLVASVSTSSTRGHKLSRAKERVATLERQLGERDGTIESLRGTLAMKETALVGWREKFDGRVRSKVKARVRAGRGEWLRVGRQQGYENGQRAGRRDVLSNGGLASGGMYVVSVSDGQSLKNVASVTAGSCYEITSSSANETGCGGSGGTIEATTTSSCDVNYTGACLDPNASDYDCAGGSGDGPMYTGPVQVVGYDEFGLDSDGDGYACE